MASILDAGVNLLTGGSNIGTMTQNATDGLAQQAAMANLSSQVQNAQSAIALQTSIDTMKASGMNLLRSAINKGKSSIEQALS